MTVQNPRSVDLQKEELATRGRPSDPSVELELPTKAERRVELPVLAISRMVLSEYELSRQANIETNNRALAALGLLDEPLIPSSLRAA